VALGVTQARFVLNRGRIAYSGPSADLLADPQRLTTPGGCPELGRAMLGVLLPRFYCSL